MKLSAPSCAVSGHKGLITLSANFQFRDDLQSKHLSGEAVSAEARI
jgi:hypothetical protein